MITDKELYDRFLWWLDHYEKNGDRHYDDTNYFKRVEIYWDLIINRVLNELPMISDEENENIVNRLSEMF